MQIYLNMESKMGAVKLLINQDQKEGLKVKGTKANLRKRYRGKRKPKRKENRRRVRPGKSRKGLRAISAPLNNNEFLINQRVSMMSVPGMNEGAFGLECDNVTKNKSFFGLEQVTNSGTATSDSPQSASSKSNETSDYDSEHSPTSECSSNHWEENYAENDTEPFDVDFALRNFEADYFAHQQEMKEELINLPRQQLELRCSLLMDQLKDLEKRRELLYGKDRITDLEQELELLRRENRLLKGKAIAAE